MAFTTAFGGDWCATSSLTTGRFSGSRTAVRVAHDFYRGLCPSLLKHFRSSSYSVFIWSDAVGLGFFSAGGTALSLQAGLPPLPAAILGVCTGAFGGMIRDVF